VRFDRPLQGSDVMTPPRPSSCNDERSPLKSFSGRVGVWAHMRLIFRLSRSGAEQEKCSARTGRTWAGLPETDKVLNRPMCGTIRTKASSQSSVSSVCAREISKGEVFDRSMYTLVLSTLVQSRRVHNKGCDVKNSLQPRHTWVNLIKPSSLLPPSQ